MKAAMASECAKGFLEWTSRFGAPVVAVSDNGNTFVANLWKEVMKTFNVEVRFTPAYHPQSNGAIENRHKTIKDSLKAALIDMGSKHKEEWPRALPWVLLGKRVAHQPDLDTSAAQLCLGKSVSLPGQMLGLPGPPLTSLQTKALLEQLYKMSAKPPIPTSSVA